MSGLILDGASIVRAERDYNSIGLSERRFVGCGAAGRGLHRQNWPALLAGGGRTATPARGRKHDLFPSICPRDR